MIDVNVYREEYNAIVDREKNMKKELYLEMLKLVKEKEILELKVKPQGYIANDITHVTAAYDKRNRLQLCYKDHRSEDYQFFHSAAICTGAHIDLYEAIIKSI